MEGTYRPSFTDSAIQAAWDETDSGNTLPGLITGGCWNLMRGDIKGQFTEAPAFGHIIHSFLYLLVIKPIQWPVILTFSAARFGSSGSTAHCSGRVELWHHAVLRQIGAALRWRGDSEGRWRGSSDSIGRFHPVTIPVEHRVDSRVPSYVPQKWLLRTTSNPPGVLATRDATLTAHRGGWILQAADHFERLEDPRDPQRAAAPETDLCS